MCLTSNNLQLLISIWCAVSFNCTQQEIIVVRMLRHLSWFSCYRISRVILLWIYQVSLQFLCYIFSSLQSEEEISSSLTMEALQNLATSVATVPMAPIFVVAHMILVSLSLRGIPGKFFIFLHLCTILLNEKTLIIFWSLYLGSQNWIHAHYARNSDVSSWSFSAYRRGVRKNTSPA